MKNSKVLLSALLAFSFVVTGCSPEFNAKKKLRSLASIAKRGLNPGEGVNINQGGGDYATSASFKLSGVSIGVVAHKVTPGAPNTSSGGTFRQQGGLDGQLTPKAPTGIGQGFTPK